MLREQLGTGMSDTKAALEEAGGDAAAEPMAEWERELLEQHEAETAAAPAADETPEPTPAETAETPAAPVVEETQPETTEGDTTPESN